MQIEFLGLEPLKKPEGVESHDLTTNSQGNLKDLLAFTAQVDLTYHNTPGGKGASDDVVRMATLRAVQNFGSAEGSLEMYKDIQSPDGWKAMNSKITKDVRAMLTNFDVTVDDARLAKVGLPDNFISDMRQVEHNAQITNLQKRWEELNKKSP